MAKIYDCFLFFNELELLDLRLNLLNEVVDKFVIVESTITFSGNSKKVFFEENKNKFEEFKDKIIHVIIDDTPDDFINLPFIIEPISKKDEFSNKVLEYVNKSTGWDRKSEKQWGREIYQRQSIIKALIDCADDDIIITSDVDEIPNPIELRNINCNDNDVIEFKQNMFYYNLNSLKERGWSGPKLNKWSLLKENSIASIRENKLTNNIIENGGWHLSFMGGEDRIKDKIEAYAHQEFNNDYIKSNISNNITDSNDPFFRGSLLNINIEEEFPEKLLKIVREKYNYMIK
jgi:beta-1,4-mannosyl-glycoprotein beta-1,4-N-acetylglucosaminyltransferase